MGMIDNYCTIVGFQRAGGKPFGGRVFGAKNTLKIEIFVFIQMNYYFFFGHIVTAAGPLRARVRAAGMEERVVSRDPPRRH